MTTMVDSGVQPPRWPARCPCCGREATTRFRVVGEVGRTSTGSGWEVQTRALEVPSCAACRAHVVGMNPPAAGNLVWIAALFTCGAALFWHWVYRRVQVSRGASRVTPECCARPERPVFFDRDRFGFENERYARAFARLNAEDERAGAPSSAAASGPPGLPGDVHLTGFAGDKIAAVKLVRELAGLGLREAKEAVDEAQAGSRSTVAVRDVESFLERAPTVGLTASRG